MAMDRKLIKTYKSLVPHDYAFHILPTGSLTRNVCVLWSGGNCALFSRCFTTPSPCTSTHTYTHWSLATPSNTLHTLHMYTHWSLATSHPHALRNNGTMVGSTRVAKPPQVQRGFRSDQNKQTMHWNRDAFFFLNSAAVTLNLNYLSLLVRICENLTTSPLLRFLGVADRVVVELRCELSPCHRAPPIGTQWVGAACLGNSLALLSLCRVELQRAGDRLLETNSPTPPCTPTHPARVTPAYCLPSSEQTQHHTLQLIW